MDHIVSITDIKKISGFIKRIRTTKPKDYSFFPGQHTSISINTPRLKNKKRFFSLSSSPKMPYLEFIIKIYLKRDGLTKEIDKLKKGGKLIIGDAKGKIKYKGKGIFLSGGVGITPFLSIFYELKKSNKIDGNRLFFMNKTKKDIIYEKELKKIFKKNIIFTLTREKRKNYENGKINKLFLRNHIKNFNQKFYLCGNFKWVLQSKKDLIELGAKQKNIISEI